MGNFTSMWKLILKLMEMTHIPKIYTAAKTVLKKKFIAVYSCITKNALKSLT